MKFRIAVVAIAMLALGSHGAFADATVGYNCVPVPAGSDTYVSVPFTGNAAAELVVDNASGNIINLTTAGLTANQFATVYYVRFTTGALAGKWFTIQANTASSLTVLGDVTGAGNGDEMSVIRHWTLETIFPDGMEGISFVGGNVLARQFEVRYINSGALAATNKSSTDTFYYNSGSKGWRRVGSSPIQSFDNFIIPPQGVLILRNIQAASTGNPDDPETLADESTGDLKFYALGECKDIKVIEVLPIEAVQNDVIVSAMNAFPVKLADLNLGGSPAFVTSPNILVRNDELRVYDNALLATNKTTSNTFYYSQGAWRRFGSPFATTFDTFELPEGAVLVVRKIAGTPGTAEWTVKP